MLHGMTSQLIRGAIVKDEKNGGRFVHKFSQNTI